MRKSAKGTFFIRLYVMHVYSDFYVMKPRPQSVFSITWSIFASAKSTIRCSLISLPLELTPIPECRYLSRTIQIGSCQTDLLERNNVFSTHLSSLLLFERSHPELI